MKSIMIIFVLSLVVSLYYFNKEKQNEEGFIHHKSKNLYNF